MGVNIELLKTIGIFESLSNDAYVPKSDGAYYIYNLGGKIHCEKIGQFTSQLFDDIYFVFEVTGCMDDDKMAQFNTAERMSYLHKIGCDLKFVDTAKPLAKANLIKCGGLEMPAIVAGMLKKYYYENLSSRTSMEDCVEYLADNDIVGYGFDDLKETYRGKIAHLLLCTFTGMRLGSKWNGRQEVNGGYIVVKNDGDVVAFHSTIADEFKDFLVAKMIMESPSHSRHKDMTIYKEGNRYFLKLALQLRFILNR